MGNVPHPYRLASLWALAMAFLAFATGCDRLSLPWIGAPGGNFKAAMLDGVTQSTPLVVGTVVDTSGRPVT